MVNINAANLSTMLLMIYYERNPVQSGNKKKTFQVY